MIVKIIPRGSGGGSGPVNYLLGRNGDREGATVLRGNPTITRELINATDYARRYTSICLSFEEQPGEISEEIKNQIMDNFEKTIFAGLESDQYNVLWVEHTDKERLELNFLAPNQELRSGKRLQPFYHVADLKRVDAYQSVMNLHFGLSDPHNPAKERSHTPYFDSKINLKSIEEKRLTEPQKVLTERQKVAQDLTDHIYDLASQARFKHTAGSRKSQRDLVVDEIKRKGYKVERMTKKSISVSHPKFKKNIRLKDPIFAEDFDQRDYIGVSLLRNKEREEQGYREEVKDGSLLKKNLETLNKGIMIKELYHRERFKDAKAPEPLIDIDLQEGTEIVLETTKDGDQEMVNYSLNW